MNATIDCKELSLREANSRIRDAVSRGEKVVLVNASHLYGLVSGLKAGEIMVKGETNDYLGMLNHGAKILVEGDAGSFVGDNSWDGEIWVKGSAGDGLGMYAYGGKFITSGNAGNTIGQMNKGGTIVIGGNVGDNVGLFMVGGQIVICGNAGKNLGHMMIRGAIYIGGNVETLGANTKYEALNEEDKAFLQKSLTAYNMKVDVTKFKKLVPISPRPF